MFDFPCPECGGPIRGFAVERDRWWQCLKCPWITRDAAWVERQEKLVIHPGDFDDLRDPKEAP